MTREEIMQAVESEVVGNQYQLFGYQDIDNAMQALGAYPIFDEISLKNFINDEIPCWSFLDDENEVVNIGIRYKIISGENELKNLLANENAEDWEIQEAAEKAKIEITAVEEI